MFAGHVFENDETVIRWMYAFFHDFFFFGSAKVWIIIRFPKKSGNNFRIYSLLIRAFVSLVLDSDFNKFVGAANAIIAVAPHIRSISWKLVDAKARYWLVIG